VDSIHQQNTKGMTLIIYATRMNLYNLIFQMVFLLYDINKMATNGGGGEVDISSGD
jgi:hypothetical protein